MFIFIGQVHVADAELSIDTTNNLCRINVSRHSVVTYLKAQNFETVLGFAALTFSRISAQKQLRLTADNSQLSKLRNVQSKMVGASPQVPEIQCKRLYSKRKNR